jgi:broad-specificity NMP kinase
MTRTEQTLNKYLNHMYGYMTRDEKGKHVINQSSMLTSPPGVGKTTFIHDLAKILGVALVKIEAPHIVEEKLINVPFLVERGAKKQRSTTNISATPNSATKEYDIMLADSHLYDALVDATALNDKEYRDSIYNLHKDMIPLYESMGGTEEEIPHEIREMRHYIRVILFVDEYFRSSSVVIDNLLRTLLQRNLGMHKLPDDVYVTFATNVTDVGGSVRAQLPNERFFEHPIEVPTIDEWFDWLMGQFKSAHSGVKINQPVMDEFKTLLETIGKNKEGEFTTNYLSHEHVTEESDIIRLSPRRWEQLVLYVNSAFPFESTDPEEKKYEAMALLTNVNTNFLHYITKESHPIAKHVLDCVIKLIKDFEGISLTSMDLHEEHDWHDTIMHQVQLKQRLGNSRSYVPVVSGPPGIGKTAIVGTMAKKLNLRLIVIECSQFTDAADVIGLAAPTEYSENKYKLKFTRSKLEKMIQELIALEDSHYRAQVTPEEYEKYQKERWKYLIFFDEFSTTPVPVQNALRQVMLEKKFGEEDADGNEHKLPDEAIIVAAINPTGAQTNELTHHMRDVLDIIPANASWQKVMDHAVSEQYDTRKGHTVGKGTKEGILNAYNMLLSKHGDTEVPKDKRPFYMDIGLGEGNSIYISPDRITQSVKLTAMSIQDLIEAAKKRAGGEITQLAQKDFDKLKNNIKVEIFEGLSPMLRNVMTASQVDRSDIDNHMKDLKAELTSPSNEYGNSIIESFAQKGKTLESLLEDHLLESTMHGYDIFADDIYNALKKLTPNVLGQQCKAWIIEKCNTPEAIHKYLIDRTQNCVELNPDDLDELRQSNLKISPMLNLIAKLALAVLSTGLSNDYFEILRRLTQDPCDDIVGDAQENNELDPNDSDNNWEIYNEYFKMSSHVHIYIEYQNPHLNDQGERNTIDSQFADLHDLDDEK